MIPLRDDNPTVLTPVVTGSLIVVNVAVFFYELSLDPRTLDALFYHAGMVPAALAGGHLRGAGGYATVLTSMFLHGGWMHIIGNMLYLWIFGNNVEDSMGHLRFIIFYLLAGVAAALTHLLLNPDATVPTIGASGAISGVLGAYLVLYPRARILTLIPLGFFWQTVYLPAWVLLIFWIGLQVLSQSLAPADMSTGGIAYAAHIGGFAAGIVLLPFFRKHRSENNF